MCEDTEVKHKKNDAVLVRRLWEFALQSNNRDTTIQILMAAKEDYTQLLYERLRGEVDEDTIPDETIEALKSLNILLMDVCESHLIETRLAHPPTGHQKEALEQLGVIVGNQKFTSEEDEIIKQNWERFEKEYGYTDPKLFMEPILKHSERMQFVRYIGRGLPHRTLYSIFGRFQRLYSIVNDGPFSPQDDLLVALHLESYNKPDPFSKLAKLLNRDRIAVFKRYKYVVRNEQTSKTKWSMENVETILKSLIKVTNTELKEFQTKPISWNTWLEVEKLTGISAVRAKSLWHRKLYAQLYSTQPIYMFKIKSHLVKRLHKSRVKSWQQIDWNAIAKDFDGINSLFLWTVMNRMLRKFFKDYRKRNVREMMKFLREHHIKKLKTNPADYRLQRLWLADSGKLIIKEEDGHSSDSEEVKEENNISHVDEV